MTLIDKAEIVAKIKERIETYNKGYANGDERRADALEVLLHDINALEVEEVDLEKEARKFIKDNCTSVMNLDDIMIFAKHFFELGLKANKGE